MKNGAQQGICVRLLRLIAFECALALSCGAALPQARPPVPAPPTQFEIGLHTFFDFGPPFNFYELFLVRPSASGTSVERITLTPAGNECFAPAKVETASGSLGESVATLLGSTNPCAIPEKELRRELKRCKHCMVFSGANVVMEVQCGAQTRLIRADILEKYWFDRTAKAPQNTSWMMGLLERLGRAVGPGVMEKPAFATPAGDSPPPMFLDSATLSDLSAGKYDPMFKGAPDKPSDLYRASQSHPVPPSVQLLSSAPISPELYVPPEYPPLARAARVEGEVFFKFDIDSSGGAINLSFESGHPLLLEAVKKAVSSWRFPKDAANQQISATVDFTLNCPKQAGKL
jgi:TonB family protein